jgi:uncharacterized membrane protein
MALAVLTKDENGQLQVERHDSTTKHLAWTGVAVGAAQCVICPPAGIAAVAAGAGAGAGVGAWVGHFWNQIPKEDIHELGGLLESGESAIFVVTVNPKQTDIAPLLMHPERSKVIQTKAGDWDAVADQAIKQAQKDQAARERPRLARRALLPRRAPGSPGPVRRAAFRTVASWNPIAGSPAAGLEAALDAFGPSLMPRAALHQAWRPGWPCWRPAVSPVSRRPGPAFCLAAVPRCGRGWLRPQRSPRRARAWHLPAANACAHTDRTRGTTHGASPLWRDAIPARCCLPGMSTRAELPGVLCRPAVPRCCGPERSCHDCDG